MPSLIHRLARQLSPETQLYQDLRYLLLVCCVYVFFNNSDGALPTIPFDRLEISLVYRYNMIKVADAALVIHGHRTCRPDQIAR